MFMYTKDTNYEAVNMEYIKIDKESIDDLLDIFNMKDIKCKFCNVKINKNNFGLINKNVQACNDKVCITIAVIEIDGD